jgi:hypothetical protein
MKTIACVLLFAVVSLAATRTETVTVIKTDTLIRIDTVKVLKYDTLKITKTYKDTSIFVKQDTAIKPSKKK